MHAPRWDADAWDALRVYAPSFAQLIQLYFILITTTALLAGTLPFLRESILSYGKLNSPTTATAGAGAASSTTTADHLVSEPSLKESEATPVASAISSTTTSIIPTTVPSPSWLGSFQVPKMWFAHFYVFATLWMVYLSLDLWLFTNTVTTSVTAADTKATLFRQFSPALGHPSSSSWSSSSSYLGWVWNLVVAKYPSWSFLTLLQFLGVQKPFPLPLPQQQLPLQQHQQQQQQPPGQLFMDTTYSLSIWPRWMPVEVLLAMGCYLVQVIRRWYESWFVERPSPSARMHVGHYLVGISFYAAMAPAIWVDAYEAWCDQHVASSSSSSSSRALPAKSLEGAGWMWTNRIQCLVGLGLFFWASVHQYRCHAILANLRSPSLSHTLATRTGVGSVKQQQQQQQQQSAYKVPMGDWFRYMVTPHYSAEMVIYFSLYLIASSGRSALSASGVVSYATTLAFAAVWTVVNLGIVAKETDQWYRAKFGEEYQDAVDSTTTTAAAAKKGLEANPRRSILIPFVY